MKTIEEKARAYDEAIKKAVALYKASEPMSGCNVIIETLFPELAESEDEKVKNKLINLIKMSNEAGGFALHKWEADEMLAWIDKQGEQKPADSYCHENCKGFQETGKCFADGECKAKKEAEQELTDLNEFINELSKQFPDISFAKLSRIVVRVAKWAKSNQPKQEWSEEDEEMLNSTISFVEHSAFTTIGKGKNNVIAWLKSLRPQNHWKPSDEQIKVCKEVYADILSAKGFNLGTVNSELNRLEEELKKLKK